MLFYQIQFKDHVALRIKAWQCLKYCEFSSTVTLIGEAKLNVLQPKQPLLLIIHSSRVPHMLKQLNTASVWLVQSLNMLHLFAVYILQKIYNNWNQYSYVCVAAS